MMGKERNTPSVIAKLMGLDEVPSKQQPVYRQQRALSENYLRKSASIGSREERSSKARQKSRLVQKKVNSRINDSSKDGSSRCLEQRSHSFDSMQGFKSTIVDSQKSGENRELDKGVQESDDLFKFLRPNLGNVKHASTPSFLLDSHTPFAWEFKKQLLEKSKMTKVCQEVRSGSRGCNLGGMLSMPNPESKRRSQLGTRVVISSNEGWKDESVDKLPIFKRINFSSNPNKKFKKMSKIDMKPSSGKHHNNVPTNFKDVVFSCGDAKTKRISEQIACNDSAKEGCSSCSSDVSFEQDSPCEDGFMYSNCIEIDELSKSTGEAYQPSPNSVLEPSFKEDNSSSSECGESVSTALHGLWIKLQVLKSELEENQSRPEMVTSSDGDATERSSFCACQNTKPIRCFGPKESREFSYLVDVLEESGFHGGSVVVSSERWHSPECMINPLLFETLEKKYGKQETWSKADRRLLFDRINAGVSEILRPCVDFLVCSKPLRRHMSARLRRDIVEEELWKLLLSQENEVNKQLSEKAIGREPWLELTDEVDSIVREIEAFLFDELAAELIVI